MKYIEIHAPRTDRHIHWYHKINPIWVLFGNWNDGPYGYGNKSWKPPAFWWPYITISFVDWPFVQAGWRQIERANDWKPWRAFWWWLRNPFHNLFFYVIGLSEWERAVYSDYPRKTFNPQNGWLHAWVKATEGPLRWLPLPFVSYQSTGWQFYAGWRPTGALGFAARRNPNRPRK